MEYNILLYYINIALKRWIDDNVIINFDRNVQVHHFNKRDNFKPKVQ